MAIGFGELVAILGTTDVADVNEGRIENQLVVVNYLRCDDEAEGSN